MRITLTTYLLFSILITSCFTPKKMDKLIKEKYETTIPKTLKLSNKDYLIIKTDSLKIQDTLSETQIVKKQIIPAVVYYQWNFTFQSDLNPKIPLSNLSPSLFIYANSMGLKQKLNGNILEISIDKLPLKAHYTDKGYGVYLLLYYFSSESIEFYPDAANQLKVSYRILKPDNTEVKRGQVMVNNKNKNNHLKYFESIKHASTKYLEAYDDYMKDAAKIIMTQIKQEI